MSDLISRADAIEAVASTKPIVRSTERNWGKMIAEQHSKELVKALKALPSADAVQGEWVDWLGNGNEWECSVCKCSIESHGSIAYNYCPMCGARMYKGGDDK